MGETMNNEMAGYVFVFLFCAGLRLVSFVFWRFFSADESEVQLCYRISPVASYQFPDGKFFPFDRHAFFMFCFMTAQVLAATSPLSRILVTPSYQSTNRLRAVRKASGPGTALIGENQWEPSRCSFPPLSLFERRSPKSATSRV